jgi:hypothetical protein
MRETLAQVGTENHEIQAYQDFATTIQGTIYVTTTAISKTVQF